MKLPTFAAKLFASTLLLVLAIPGMQGYNGPETAINRANQLASQLHNNAFDQKTFDAYATEYGNKAANLEELRKIAPTIPVKGKCVQVPSFFAISDKEVQQFLSKTRAMNAVHPFVLEEVKYQLGIMRQFAHKSNQVHIENAFTNSTFKFEHPKRQATFEEYVKNAVGNNNLFMVRSSGKEDTKEFANAGGNKSIAAVWPHDQAISKSMGQVVASYFSEKSISQRLLAGDKTVFNTVFMPALVQVMICKDPISGVIFSQEAEGQTPGVTHIEAAYGHGEGIVNGLVPVDSYYIGQSGIIHPIIRNKHERIMPSADFTHLEKVPNSTDRATKPCLTPALIKDLKIVADTVQAYYGYPVDIEFVIQDDVIYLVQARPIVAKQQKASYLSDDFVKNAQEKITVLPIVSGKNAVCANLFQKYPIRSINEQTINLALDTFLNLNAETKSSLEAIIVGQMAPSTSHEATTFRGANKVVVYVAESDRKRIMQWIAGHAPVALDVQRGLIILLDPSKKPEMFLLEEKPGSSALRHGWFAHPIPAKCSLFSEFIELNQMPGLKPEECFKGKNISTTQLLNMLKNGSAQEATDALKTILARVSGQIAHAQKQAHDKTTILQLKNIYAHAITCAQETMMALTAWETSAKTESDRLARLYPITFFEAVIRQTPMKDEFLNGYSAAALLKIDHAEQKIADTVAKVKQGFRPFAVQLAKVGSYALTPELEQLWNAFITELSEEPLATRLDFTRMIHSLAQNNMLAEWINISFAQAIQKKPTTFFGKTKQQLGITHYEPIKELLQQYNEIMPLLIQLQSCKTKLDPIAKAPWQNPEKFIGLRDQLSKECIQPLGSRLFFKTYENTPLLGKIAIQHYLYELINTFDGIIKTFKSSQDYPDIHLLIGNFRELLLDYWQLMDHLAKIPCISADIYAMRDKNTFKSTKEYFDDINRNITNANRMNPEELLLPSRGTLLSSFSVAAAMLGSKANYTRHCPETLEDIFTLIHQNLLAIVRTLAAKTNLVSMLPMPPLVKKVIDNFKSFKPGFWWPSPSFIGISIDKNTVTYFYNLPLNNHSSTFQITFDKKDPNMAILSIQFLGQARDRFAKIARYINQEYGHSLRQTPTLDENRGILSFAWKITPTTNLKEIYVAYKTACEMTFA